MKESHSEDQASHAGPESCEGVGNGALEALTGEPAGRAIEPRNQLINREADTLMASGRPHRICRHGKAGSAPARSENQGMWGRFSRGSREIPSLARPRMRSGPRRESPGSTTPMNGHGKSDRSIVTEKSAYKARVREPAAELMEERERAKGSPSTQTSLRAQCRTRLPHELDGTRRAAQTAWPLLPEAGAQCVNRARWDLCGGRRATGGPTATGPDRDFPRRGIDREPQRPGRRG
jgi:hypothetical protein